LTTGASIFFAGAAITGAEIGLTDTGAAIFTGLAAETGS